MHISVKKNYYIKGSIILLYFFISQCPLIFSCPRRSQSFRQSTLHASKRSQSQNAVNTSISAHPLLPIETGLYYLFVCICHL